MKVLTKPLFAKWSFLFSLVLFGFLSCQKGDNHFNKKGKHESEQHDDNHHGHLKQTKTFSSEVVIKWLNMQLDMLRVPLAPGTGSQGADRCQAYCGLAAYESVVPGMPAYRSLTGQLTEFPTMPVAEPGKAYHWAASANAALAFMNRKLFLTTSDANKTRMDSLESSLQSQYAAEVDAATLQRSINFGKEVATRIAVWAATDGSAIINPPYTPPVGFGLWVPTASTPPVNPFAHQTRLLVPGVANGTALVAPPQYDTVPGSPFFLMVKDVYDKSLVLTTDQIAMAVYHRDAPGYPGGGHFVAVLSQVFAKAKPALDVAAVAYAKVGLGQHEASAICFINKYQYLTVRPITYIRNVMKYGTWSPTIPTPNHPEFPSAHAVNSSAVATMLTNVFGDNFHFTLHTYDYLGLPARSYNSFGEMCKEMADSRVYGGIHYQASCDKGLLQGKKVGMNVLNKVKFLKQ